MKIRTKLFEYLTTKECLDCGENDPIVLDFDHTEPKKKYKSISKMLSGHWSWLSITKEIAKCEIRCANCHRRKTYKEQGSFGRTKQTKKPL